MTESDKPRLAVIVNALAATFRAESSKAMLTGYWGGLCDLPIETIEQAGQCALRTCMFMPTPAELRVMAGEMTPADRAVKAWEAFVLAERKHGYYTTVDFDDKLINATVRNMGGWMAITVRMDEDDKTDKWVRKDFERIYISLLRSGISEQAGSPLIGFHEQNNMFLGYDGETIPNTNKPVIGPPTRITTGLPPVSYPKQIGVGTNRRLAGREE